MPKLSAENFKSLKLQYTRLYKEFVLQSELPPALIGLSLQGLEKLGPDNVYVMYPRLFADAVGNADESQVERLSIAGYLYFQSLMNIDRIYDYEKHGYNLFTLLTLLNLQEESVKILTALFPPESAFWKQWNLRKAEFVQAMTFPKGEVFTISRFKALSIHKSAFAKIAIDALYFLNKQQERAAAEAHYHALLKSHDHFSIAMQILDDVKDIHEDILLGQRNIAVEKLIINKLADRAEIQTSSAEEVKKMLHYSGTSIRLFRMAVRELKQAQREIEETPESYYGIVLSELLQNVRQRIFNLGGILAIVAAKKKDSIVPGAQGQEHLILHKLPKNRLEKILIHGFNYIMAQQSQGFTELKHYMFLGKNEQFSNTIDVHGGDVFQRAILIDALADVAGFLKTDFNSYLREETDYLISAKNKDAVQGWSYFQTVQEIAADADDLAQVILALVRRDPKLAASHAKIPLQILLANNLSDNGGLETWIIPKHNRTKRQERQAYFNVHNWGTGPDVEVNANILYALILLDKQRYHAVIQQGITYVLSQKRADGLWNSRWYCGDKYGTYMAFKLLKAYDEDMLMRESKPGIAALLQSQHADGGWGMDQQTVSDPLSTALALLSLKLLASQELKTAIDAAKKYLISTQNPEQHYWQGVEFILPRFNQPYKSKTLTTALVLKALVS